MRPGRCGGRAQGNVAPAQVRCHGNEAVRSTDYAGDGHAHTRDLTALAMEGVKASRQSGEVLDRLLEREMPARTLYAALLADLATEAHNCAGDGIDRDL